MKHLSRAVIVANGEPPSPSLLESLLATRPLLLCADGGANVAVSAGYFPDYVVGDLDSVTPEVSASLSDDRLIEVSEDDTGTDLEKVLRFAVRIGVRTAAVLGATGGRTDHTLWNLGLLRLFAPDLRLRILDDYCEIRLIDRKVRFSAPVGKKISLSPCSGPVTGIRTRGLRFALLREMLASGERDGISNEVVDDPVEISVESGDLLLVVQNDGRGEVVWEDDGTGKG